MKRRGMVLVLVLVVVALLTLACFTFCKLMLSERKAANLSARQAQARALADSAVEMVRWFVVQDKETQDELGGWYNNQARFRGVLVVDDQQGQDPGRFAIVAPQMFEGVAQGIRFGLEDESTRLNLNTLAVANQAGEDAGRQILMGLPGMTEEIADAILDWIDEDDEPRQYGAEVDYYASLEPGYAPKNGPLETVEELLLVRGVTPWLLFGPDANRNGFLDPGEPSDMTFENADNSDGSMNRGWAAYLTLYSKESNLDPDGKPKIDLNKDDLKELYDELEQAVGAQYATFIVALRQGKDAGDEPGVPVSGGEELDLSASGSTKFSTVLDLIGKNVRVKLKDADEETVLETPFPDVPGVMSSYLPTLMDHVAVNASPVIPGRININQAPRVVLEGIPGMKEETVDTILAERVENPTDMDPSRRHETWLLSEGIVTLEEMRSLMPFVTGGGSVYRAQIVGYFDRGGPAVRIEAVVDATQKPARVLFYRDLSHLGRGYALETLGIEALDQ
jgi:hypothetical protein